MTILSRMVTGLRTMEVGNVSRERLEICCFVMTHDVANYDDVNQR